MESKQKSNYEELEIAGANLLAATVTKNITVGNAPWGVVFNPNGKFAYVTNRKDNNVSIIDSDRNTLLKSVDVGGSPEGIAVSPDGKSIYVAVRLKSVSIIDSNSYTITPMLLKYDFESITVSPNGKKVYVTDGASGHDAYVFDAESKTYDQILENVGFYPFGIAVNPDGKTIYVAGTNSNTLALIDAGTYGITTIKCELSPVQIAVSPNGKKLYITCIAGNCVKVYNTEKNTFTDKIIVGNAPWGVAVNPVGTEVYVANRKDNSVSVIDAIQNRVTATVPVGVSPNGIAVSPDGKIVYVTNTDSNTVSVIDVFKVRDTVDSVAKKY